MSPAATTVPASRRCPQCRRAFGCGALAPDGFVSDGFAADGFMTRAAADGAPPLRCWCAALPPLPGGPDCPPLPADCCLCPDCYARRLAGQPAGGRVTPTE
ncbi:hypothetical protein Bpla01_13250 [Burkholderia plantarii]|nr:hypothetical protein Bpla01_13250 [Burkholderia plantarii]